MKEVYLKTNYILSNKILKHEKYNCDLRLPCTVYFFSSQRSGSLDFDLF